MNRTLIFLSVFLTALFPVVLASAAEEMPITDSSGSVILEHVDRDSIPTIVRLLDDQDYQVWKQAEGALVSFGKEAVPELLKAVEKAPPPVRAVTVLGYIKDGRAVVPLSRLINSSSHDVADAARSALSAIGGPAVGTLAGLLKDGGYRDAAAATLKNITPSADALDVVRPLLKSDDGAARAAAADVLGMWKDSGSLYGIRALLDDGRVEVREKAVVAYRLAAEEYDIDLLLRLAEDKSGLVRREAMAMMTRNPSPKVVEPMLRIMATGGVEDRAAAIAAAGYTKDPRLVEPLIKALDDTDDRVAGNAVYFLGYQNAAQARPNILALIKKRREFSDPMVIQNACEALVVFGEPLDADDLHMFLAYLGKGSNYDTRYAVLDLVEKYGSSGDAETMKAIEAYIARETDQVLLMRAESILARLR